MPELSIDALNPSGTKTWRLQRDHTWRKARFAEPLREGDFATVDPGEARTWLEGRLDKDWRGRVSWKPAPGKSTLAPGDISLHAIAHRREPVPVPDRAELVRVLGEAPSEGRHMIGLDLEGEFLLRDPEWEPAAGDPALAAHGDSLSGPAYLGPEAAANERYVDELYHSFLAAWYQHLRSGRVSVYAGEPAWDLSAEELERRIRAWEPAE